MPAITFIHPDGKSDRVETAGGESVMQAATRHGLDGILAECGGNAMCGDLPCLCRRELARATACDGRRRGRTARRHRR